MITSRDIVIEWFPSDIPMMNDKEFIDEGVMIIYMDDILIFGQPRNNIGQLFYGSLISFAFTSRLKSSHLDSQQSSTLAPSSQKVVLRWTQSWSQEWPTPRKVIEVQSFIDFVNFYQHFFLSCKCSTNVVFLVWLRPRAHRSHQICHASWLGSMHCFGSGNIPCYTLDARRRRSGRGLCGGGRA